VASRKDRRERLHAVAASPEAVARKRAILERLREMPPEEHHLGFEGWAAAVDVLTTARRYEFPEAVGRGARQLNAPRVALIVELHAALVRGEWRTAVAALSLIDDVPLVDRGVQARLRAEIARACERATGAGPDRRATEATAILLGLSADRVARIVHPTPRRPRRPRV
jgi:hypothetical protein